MTNTKNDDQDDNDDNDYDNYNKDIAISPTILTIMITMTLIITIMTTIMKMVTHVIMMSWQHPLQSLLPLLHSSLNPNNQKSLPLNQREMM